MYVNSHLPCRTITDFGSGHFDLYMHSSRHFVIPMFSLYPQALLYSGYTPLNIHTMESSAP